VSVGAERRQVVAQVRAIQVDAVVAKEYPESVRLVGLTDQVFGVSNGDPHTAAQARETLGEAGGDCACVVPVQPRREQIDVRPPWLRLPGGDGPVQVDRDLTPCRQFLHGSCDEGFEHTGDPGPSGAGDDRAVRRDPFTWVEHPRIPLVGVL